MKNIPLFKVYMSKNASKKINKVLDSGFIGQGQKVDEFEKKLENLWQAKNVLTVNSGTSALSLAYHLIGLKKGDEVITTPITCLATNSPLLALSCKIVWADVDPLTGLIDPEDVKKKITKRTKAIVCVDWEGRPCDYDALKSFGIPVVQDAAHSFMTYYKGKHIANSGGDYVCFSFQAIKHLTCIDGGVIKVPKEQFDRAKLLRWYGFDREGSSSFRCAQDVKECGFKYHMNDANAAVGIANLKGAQVNVFKSQMNAKDFCEFLSKHKIFEFSTPT